MHDTVAFGQWAQQPRRALDLTQEELARRVDCALVTIHKLETGQRCPSRQLAELLAAHLEIALAERDAFVAWARRGSASSLHTPTRLPMPGSRFPRLAHPFWAEHR